MRKLLRSFCKGEEGATAVEYGLMVALIAAVIIAAVDLLGEEVNGAFEYVGGEIATAVPAAEG